MDNKKCTHPIGQEIPRLLEKPLVGNMDEKQLSFTQHKITVGLMEGRKGSV